MYPKANERTGQSPSTKEKRLLMFLKESNYLRFSIYDLKLTNLWGNSELRRLLFSTGSIYVIEDIDIVPLHSQPDNMEDSTELKERYKIIWERKFIFNRNNSSGHNTHCFSLMDR